MERCRILYVSPLKALAVDVERNLRTPIAGVAATAERLGLPYRVPTVAIRSGDTPQVERARISRTPPDILITTPESLYLLLTSRAREMFASLETIIVDEIHAIAATKRGAHLFVSLERVEQVRSGGRSSASGLGDAAASGGDRAPPRRRRGRGCWALREVAAAARRDRGRRQPQGLRADGRGAGRGHGAPGRGAGRRADGGLAGRTVHLAVDLSAAGGARPRAPLDDDLRQQPPPGGAAGRRDQRVGRRGARAGAPRLGRARETPGDRGAVEARRSARDRRDLLAELGIDMGAVDQVIQIEGAAVASGMQRIGRAGHCR